MFISFPFFSQVLKCAGTGKINWLVIYSMMSLIGVGYFIVSASLHQFVTSSSSPEDPTVRHYCRPIVFPHTQSFCIQVSSVLVTVKLLFMQ